MSLSWRERIGVFVAPASVTVVLQGGRSKHVHREVLQCEPAANAPAWRSPLDALRRWLEDRKSRSAAADVVLSNHFVRYLLLPWSASIVGKREESALATARFQQVYGEIARSWALRVSPDKPGAPLLAAAVDKGLIDTIGALLAGAPLRLRSIQPALMAACNQRLAGVATNAWVALAEPGQFLLGLQRDGQWRSLRSRPLNGEPVPLAELIEQERLLLGVDSAGEKVYLHEWGNPPVDTAGIAVERWSGFDPKGAARA